MDGVVWMHPPRSCANPPRSCAKRSHQCDRLGSPMWRRWQTQAGMMTLGYQEFSWPRALSPSIAEGESLSNCHLNFPTSRMVRNVFLSLCKLLSLVYFIATNEPRHWWCFWRFSACFRLLLVTTWDSYHGDKAGHHHCFGACGWGKTSQQEQTQLKTGRGKREMRRGHRLTFPSKVHPGDRWPAVAMKELTLEGSEWIGREWRESKSPQPLVRKIFCHHRRFCSAEGSSSVWWFSGWIQTGFFGWHCISKRIIIIRCLYADLLISHFMNFLISVGSIAIKSTWTHFKERNNVVSVLCPLPEAPVPCVVKLLSVLFSCQGLFTCLPLWFYIFYISAFHRGNFSFLGTTEGCFGVLIGRGWGREKERLPLKVQTLNEAFSLCFVPFTSPVWGWRVHIAWGEIQINIFLL